MQETDQKTPSYDKTAVYEEHISPIVKQLHAACEQHGVQMFVAVVTADGGESQDVITSVHISGQAGIILIPALTTLDLSAAARHSKRAIHGFCNAAIAGGWLPELVQFASMQAKAAELEKMMEGGDVAGSRH